MSNQKNMLQIAWQKRLELHAEGDKLCVEGDKLYVEGDKLRAEGDKLYIDAVVEFNEKGCQIESSVIINFE